MGAKILLCDRNEAILWSTKMVLKHSHDEFEIDIAQSFDDAKEKINTGGYTCLITSVRLNGTKSGLELYDYAQQAGVASTILSGAVNPVDGYAWLPKHRFLECLDDLIAWIKGGCTGRFTSPNV